MALSQVRRCCRREPSALPALRRAPRPSRRGYPQKPSLTLGGPRRARRRAPVAALLEPPGHRGRAKWSPERRLADDTVRPPRRNLVRAVGRRLLHGEPRRAWCHRARGGWTSLTALLLDRVRMLMETSASSVGEHSDKRPPGAAAVSVAEFLQSLQ